MNLRLMRVEVAEELIARILTEGTRHAKISRNALPADAKLVAVQFDGRTVALTYHSAKFEVVKSGDPIPARSMCFAEDDLPAIRRPLTCSICGGEINATGTADASGRACHVGCFHRVNNLGGKP